MNARNVKYLLFIMLLSSLIGFLFKNASKSSASFQFAESYVSSVEDVKMQVGKVYSVNPIKTRWIDTGLKDQKKIWYLLRVNGSAGSVDKELLLISFDNGTSYTVVVE